MENDEVINVDAVERYCGGLARNLASTAFPRFNYGIVTDRAAEKIRKELSEMVLRCAREALAEDKGEQDGQNL